MPLSFAQQRLWFIDKLEPGNVAYNLPFGLWFKGVINIPVLEYSLNEVIRRHEVLRTSFSARNGVPVQQIHDQAHVPVKLVDLRDAPEIDRDQKVECLVREEAERPFNLAEGPLLRMQLVWLAEEQYMLLGNIHHIISDGWSINIMLREISELYGSYLQGAAAMLPALPIQYADFAVEQQAWFEKGLFNEQLDYWKKQLAGVPLLDLPTDRMRPAVRSHRGGAVRFRFSDHLAARVTMFCRQERATLFMTLLAVFQVLLSRYTGESDIPVGTAIANRNAKDIRGLIGLFANTLVLRTDLDGSPTFREVLQRVQGTALEAYRNQDIPFDKLVQEIQPQRDLSWTPLFQVLMLLQSVEQEKVIDMPGLELQKYAPVSPAAKFDLTLQILHSTAETAGELSYSSELFDAQTAQRIVTHFELLLHQAVQNPACKISDLSLVTEAEQQELLRNRNQTKSPYPSQSVAEMFEQQAARMPDSPALEHDARQITYGELNRQANSLAHFLQNLGAGPETLIGVCLERGLDMVVALLGILKAGAAYVPLDPGYPRERLQYMVEDSRPAVVLTQEGLNDPWDFCRGRLVRMDRDWDLIARESQDNPERKSGLDNLAYVIYTSGSTGRPKGVEVSARALSNFICAMQEKPGIDSRDVMLAATPLSFDIAGLEIYLPLSVGARIRILSRSAGTNGVRLAKELTNGITMVQATPASWQIALETGWEGNHQLKVLCGGEALSVDLAKKLLSRSGSLWNMYGPTETTVWSLVEEIGGCGGDAISIGRPIANTAVYVLDSGMQPVPTGVRGELYLGGDGLARGYRGRPDLTAERFLPDPFGAAGGSRLYRTGDVVRWRNDATIEFLGRSDHQVKVLGHRIELGEIEAAITEAGDIARAAVIAHEDSPGAKRLVAYIVPVLNRTSEVSVDRLRTLLRQKLPGYMVPSEFIIVTELPLSPAGKVNRRALPKPSSFKRPVGNPASNATTSLQKRIAAIWSEVLYADNVGVDDNFFDLGGDSLRTVRVHNRLLETLQLNIELVDLFKFPTVRSLAEHLESNRDIAVPAIESRTAAMNAGRQRLRQQLAHRALR